MENIDDYLDQNASAEEREAAEQVLAGLSTLRLQEKINAVSKERHRRKRIAWQRIAGLIILLLLVAALILWQSQSRETQDVESTSSTEMPTEQQDISSDSSLLEAEESLPVEVPGEETPEEEPAPPPSRSGQPAPPPTRNLPIAQADPLPDPSYPSPGTFVRGQNNGVDSLAKQRLDQLWYTAYPLAGLAVADTYDTADAALRERNFTQAFIRLQRAERRVDPNDTLTYLKAYTLLEMGEGAEAARMLSEITTPPAEWQNQLQWYQALAQLLTGELDQATPLLQQIAADGQHAYQQHAKKAMEVFGLN